MTLPVSRRGVGLGIAAGLSLTFSAAVELARRPLMRSAMTGPSLIGSRVVLEHPELGPLFARHVPGRSGWSVVLVHGWSGCADVTWHAVAPRLAGGPSVWMLDLPGHGEAPATGRFDLDDAARRIAAVVDAAAADGPVTLVGYSMGGAAALTGFSMGILEQVSRYFAVATADRFATPSLSAKLWAARLLGAGSRSPFIIRQAWKRARVSKREMVAWMLQNRPSRKVLADTAAMMNRFDLSGAEFDLPVDTEWVIARLDTVIPVEEQVRSAKRHGVATIHVDSTHAVTLEDPSELAGLILSQRRDRRFGAQPI